MGKRTERERSKINEDAQLSYSSSSCYRKTRQKIKKALQKTKTTEETLKCGEIIDLLNCVPNFLGCFAQNSIDSLFLHDLPCTFLVNIDNSNEPGSHWIVLALFEDSIEVFDPLGFKFYNWQSVPCNLLTFIHSEASSKKLYISPQLQPLSSNLCAFYCMYFVIERVYRSFQSITGTFSLPCENDNLLFSSLFI